MRHEDEDVKHAERRGRHSEEVEGHDVFDMVLEKCPPGRRGRLSSFWPVFRDRRVTDLDAELGQLCLDAWLAPGGITVPHIADELADLQVDFRPTGSSLAFASPVGPKSCAVLFHDGGRLEEVECLSPSGTDARQGHPEEPVSVLEPGFLHLPFEHAELVTQGKVLEREVAT